MLDLFSCTCDCSREVSKLLLAEPLEDSVGGSVVLIKIGDAIEYYN